MKTLTVKTSENNLVEGWHVATISKAEYGSWQGTGFIDACFDELPDSLKLRVYETFNRKTGEEFAIGNLFRFANAGIQDGETTSEGIKVMAILDDPKILVGKKLSIFLYREESGYFRILNRFAPGESFTNSFESVDNLTIAFYKQKADDYYRHLVCRSPSVEEDELPF